MQGLVYADDFTISFYNALGSTIRTITKDNIDELEIDEALISNGLRDDEMVVWDGRASNGNLVAPGTYYFVVKFIKYQRDYQNNQITRTDSYEFKDYVVVARD
jgi:hypothetical protein